MTAAHRMGRRTGRRAGRRTGPPPATLARAAGGAAVLANLILVEVLFLTAGTGKNGTLTVAKLVGLHAGLILMVQVVLVARLPWLERRIGMDRLTAWHRWTGFALLWTVLTHATLVVVGYARLDGAPVTRTFRALAGVPASLLGMVAAGLIVVVGALSARYARRRLPYEVWHGLHLLVYAVIVAGLVHQWLEGTTFPSSPVARAYWWTLWALVLAALVAGRVVLPLWRNARHRLRVAAVVPESDRVVSVHVTGRDLDRLPARAGQFFVWRFPGHGGWWRANPFSLSSAPNGRSLRLTAKAVGSGSARLRHLPVGSRVFVEGPYGAFTTLNRTRPAMLLIAGGVGITPVRSLLEEDPAVPTVVLYRVRSAAEAVLLPELETLARRRGARLHLLTGPTSGAAPFAPERLLTLVPDIADRDVYVCGPPAMTEAVLRSLRALRVPRGQTHAERFGFA